MQMLASLKNMSMKGHAVFTLYIYKLHWHCKKKVLEQIFPSPWASSATDTLIHYCETTRPGIQKEKFPLDVILNGLEAVQNSSASIILF